MWSRGQSWFRQTPWEQGRTDWVDKLQNFLPLRTFYCRHQLTALANNYKNEAQHYYIKMPGPQHLIKLFVLLEPRASQSKP